jgi:hypothetical protein
MTVEGLLRELQQMIEDRPELRDAELRFAYQPTYPLYEDLSELHIPAEKMLCMISPEIRKEYDLEDDMHYILLAEDQTVHDALDTDDPQFFATYDEAEDAASQGEPYIYLSGGIDNGYLPGDISRQIGWR